MDAQDGQDVRCCMKPIPANFRLLHQSSMSGAPYEEPIMNANLLHAELTHAVIGCAFAVINELGSGFLESVYEKSMLIALADAGIGAAAQQPIVVNFRGKPVGTFYADLLVEGKVLVELKAVKALAPEHQAQVINYLKATGIEVGLLINFGNPKLEFKRLTRSPDKREK